MDTIDPDVKNLVSSIGRAETGEPNEAAYSKKGPSGEFGRYQFMPETYKAYAKKYIGDENAEPSIDNQNKIAYSFVKEKKDAGYNPAQIASMWNAGEGKPNAYKENYRGVNAQGVQYDTPAYVQKVSQYYNESKGQKPAVQQTPVPPSKESGGAWFPSNPDDTAAEAGLKALGNTPQSAANFVGGIVKTFNPVNTVKTLKELSNVTSDVKGVRQEAQDARDLEAKNNNTLIQQYNEKKARGEDTRALEKYFKGVGIDPTQVQVPKQGSSLFGDIVGGLPSAAYETLVPQGIRQAVGGDLEGAKKSFTEDPFGTVAPVVLTGVGAVKGLAAKEVASNKAAMGEYAKNPYTKKTIPEVKTRFQNIEKAMDTGIEKTAGFVTKPVTAIKNKVGSGTSTLGRSLASQLTSLDPETITKILENPKEFSKLAQEQNTRGGLAGEVQSAINKRLSELKETGKGYENIRNSKQTIKAPDFIKSVLEENGLKVKNGKVVSDTNSITRNTTDINAIQKFYTDWGNKKTMTTKEFMNMRSDLTDLAKYDRVTGMGKTRASETVGISLRDRANKLIRDTQLKELKELDEKYAPEVQTLKQIKKDYFNKDGTFKDNAPSKIANAGNKAELLARLEKIVPNAGKRIELLKAVEDIKAAMGSKVGTYTRGMLQGGSILSGNMPGLIATIITHPANAVRILRAAGYTGAKLGQIIDVLKKVAGSTEKLTAPFTSGLMNQKVNDSTY